MSADKLSNLQEVAFLEKADSWSSECPTLSVDGEVTREAIAESPLSIPEHMIQYFESQAERLQGQRRVTFERQSQAWESKATVPAEFAAASHQNEMFTWWTLDMGREFPIAPPYSPIIPLSPRLPAPNRSIMPDLEDSDPSEYAHDPLAIFVRKSARQVKQHAKKERAKLRARKVKEYEEKIGQLEVAYKEKVAQLELAYEEKNLERVEMLIKLEATKLQNHQYLESAREATLAITPLVKEIGILTEQIRSLTAENKGLAEEYVELSDEYDAIFDKYDAFFEKYEALHGIASIQADDIDILEQEKDAAEAKVAEFENMSVEEFKAFKLAASRRTTRSGGKSHGPIKSTGGKSKSLAGSTLPQPAQSSTGGQSSKPAGVKKSAAKKPAANKSTTHKRTGGKK